MPAVDELTLPNRGQEATEVSGFGASEHGDESKERRAQLTLGRFEVIRELGSGGMGQVFEAFDPKLQRKVAIKVLKHKSGSPSSTERLAREALALAKLSHPNVVQVYEVDDSGGEIFVAMEFVEGITLGEWLETRATSWPIVLSMFQQIGDGLSAAHEAGLVHRDFKPDNVIVAEDGRPRVLDFGIAMHSGFSMIPEDESDTVPEQEFLEGGGALTVTGAIMGTPAYMAPEQFLGQAAEPASDQFSFCVAMFEAVYGQRPFVARSLAALSLKVVRGELPALRPRFKVPKLALRAIHRGLANSPDKRHESLGALVEDLVRASKLGRRNAILALVALVSLGGIGISYQATAPRVLDQLPRAEDIRERRIELAELRAQSTPLSTVLIPVQHRSPSSLLTPAKTVLSSRGTVQADDAGGILMCMDTQANCNLMKQLAEKLDKAAAKPQETDEASEGSSDAP